MTLCTTGSYAHETAFHTSYLYYLLSLNLIVTPPINCQEKASRLWSLDPFCRSIRSLHTQLGWQLAAALGLSLRSGLLRRAWIETIKSTMYKLKQFTTSLALNAPPAACWRDYQVNIFSSILTSTPRLRFNDSVSSYAPPIHAARQRKLCDVSTGRQGGRARNGNSSIGKGPPC